MATSESTWPPLTDIDDPRSFFEEALYQGACAECGRMTGSWEAHHVLYKQECRRAGAPHHSPDDAIRLCSGDAARCHEREHSRQTRVHTRKLRDENIAFVRRWLGSGAAYNYLARYYDIDGDARIDQLLRESA